METQTIQKINQEIEQLKATPPTIRANQYFTTDLKIKLEILKQLQQLNHTLTDSIIIIENTPEEQQ